MWMTPFGSITTCGCRPPLGTRTSDTGERGPVAAKAEKARKDKHSMRLAIVHSLYYVNSGCMKLFLITSRVALFAAVAPAARTLDVYLIDVEGGKALLTVSPSGESLLIDVGWPAGTAREASTDRIVEAVKAAG